MADRGLWGRDHPVGKEKGWQLTARRLQSDWREREGLDPGLERGVPLASRLLPDDGKPPALRNYMTAAAKDEVQRAVREAPRTGAVLMRPRLWVDLLSSQPLCFNAFADLQADHGLAGAVLGSVWPDLVDTVDVVRFEFSPGRLDPRYTNNKSAFDVFVDATGPRGRGFLGIEVKYHEDMRGDSAKDKGYADLAARTGVFLDAALPALGRRPLQQLWLDHLLALRMLQADAGTWDWGVFVLSHPSANTACRQVGLAYQASLADDSTYRTLSLEDYLDALVRVAGPGWAQDLRDRYLGRAPAPG